MAANSKTDWAYVAAMMDGEGSFSITKSQTLSASGKLYWLFDCKVMVSNTSMKLMKWLVAHFGGSYRISVSHISKKARANGQKSIRPCGRWTVDGYENQEKFLLAVLPYLVIKKAQALVALKFVRMLGVKDPPARMKLHEQMIGLNKGIPND